MSIPSDPMLSFYKAHQVSPVRQEIQDLSTHFARRRSLYYSLGLIPPLISGRRVLEIGPGSGHNALYTASLKPARYLLLEGNDTGVQQITSLIHQHSWFKETVELRHQPISLFFKQNSERFDVVLIEAVLGGFPQPLELLPELLKLLNPQGVMVLTTVDALSSFAENIRRFLCYRAIDWKASPEEKVAALLPALSPHLKTLSSMSRRHDDWIVDNILLPLSAGYNFLTIADVAEALPDGVDIMGLSPRIARDWRWYKSLVGPSRYFKYAVAAEYWRTCHNLIDSRFTFEDQAPEKNKELYAHAHKFRDAVVAYENAPSQGPIDAAQKALSTFTNLMSRFPSELSAGFIEAQTLFQREEISPRDIASMDAFASVFGRGLQYVSVYSDTNVGAKNFTQDEKPFGRSSSDREILS